MNNSTAVERRLRLAERAAAAYMKNSHVAGVLVAGLVARGLADDRSDVELHIYWATAPTEEERTAAVEGAGWERVYSAVDEDEWADGYVIEGVKIDTSGCVTTTIDDPLDAALNLGDIEAGHQVRITALLDGRALHGRSMIDAWRSRCRDYPTKLALAMVEAGLDVRPRERLEMLAARDDVLLLHRDMVDNVQGILDALFGLNRVYVPHPFHKWLEWERAPDGRSGRARPAHPSPPHGHSTRGRRGTVRPHRRDLRPRREVAAERRCHICEDHLRDTANQLTLRQPALTSPAGYARFSGQWRRQVACVMRPSCDGTVESSHRAAAAQEVFLSGTSGGPGFAPTPVVAWRPDAR